MAEKKKRGRGPGKHNLPKEELKRRERERDANRSPRGSRPRDPEARKVYSRAYYIKNRERLLAADAARYAANPEPKKAYSREHGPLLRSQPAYRAKEAARARARNSLPENRQKNKGQHLKRLYKITLEEYQILLESQNGCCAICGRHHTEFKRAFSVDHDHTCCPGKRLQTCGKCIRGLLCHHCNAGIGYLKDSIQILQLAEKYLQKWQTTERARART
jgi:hypothetical protein